MREHEEAVANALDTYQRQVLPDKLPSHRADPLLAELLSKSLIDQLVRYAERRDLKVNDTLALLHQERLDRGGRAHDPVERFRLASEVQFRQEPTATGAKPRFPLWRGFITALAASPNGGAQCTVRVPGIHQGLHVTASELEPADAFPPLSTRTAGVVVSARGAESTIIDIGVRLKRAAASGLVADEQALTDLAQLTMRLGTWSGGQRKRSSQYPSGHANNGVAHGIAGPLALLALASLRGITVSDQREAIERICAWLDLWRIEGRDGPRWPYWITLSELESGRPSPASRPSWCYGLAGSARAQQLTALATGDTGRQRMAEEALLHAMTARTPLAATTDLSLCHGFAGLAHIVQLAAADAITPGLRECLPRLLAPIESTTPDILLACGAGLLEGATGVALALLAQVNGGTLSGWDSCLLIT
jgi:hypothetical protein